MGYPIVTFGEITGDVETEVAGALAALGAESVFVAAPAEGPVTAGAVERLRALGVNTDHIPAPGGRSISAEMGDWEVIFHDAGWFFFTGLTPGQSETGAMAALEAVRAASEEELTVFFDVSFRKTLWSWQQGVSPRELAGAVTRRILSYVDIVIASAEDIVPMVKTTNGMVPDATLTLDACCDLAAKVAEEFPNVMMVAVLLRERAADGTMRLGAMLYDVDGMMAHLAPLSEEMDITPYVIPADVDPIDGEAAFAAGLTYALTTDGLDDPPRAIGFAAAMAYLRLTQPGEGGFPARADVEALMSGVKP